jgi:hypothetical protein
VVFEKKNRCPQTHVSSSTNARTVRWCCAPSPVIAACIARTAPCVVQANRRTNSFVLARKFIEVRNTSVYPPTDKNPAGEIHEDIGYISFDKVRRQFVLRQFHIEGFVNQYVLDSISADNKTIIFVSESIENIPSGWRARETYHIGSINEITETFIGRHPRNHLSCIPRFH